MHPKIQAGPAYLHGCVAAWRTGGHCSGVEKRSIRKEHPQRSRWCRHNCENGAIMAGLVDSSTKLIVSLM
jgi:hypothetical protein